MKKKYLYCFLFFILHSCGFYNDEVLSFDRKIIKKLDSYYNKDSKNERLRGLPPSYSLSFYDYYVKGENGHFIVTDTRDLINIYERKYKKISFYDFLVAVFDQKITLNCKDNVCFKLDKEIIKIYQENKFEDFLNLYCKFNDTVFKYYLFRKDLSDNAIQTLFYYFFINGYFKSIDDYIGRVYLLKFSNFYEK